MYQGRDDDLNERTRSADDCSERQAYGEWLSLLDIDKLLINAEPGA